MTSILEQVRIGEIPSLEVLEQLQQDKFKQLINVSGVPLADIHTETVLEPFFLSEFSFPDVFSDGTPLNNQQLTSVTMEPYLESTTQETRQAFLAAVSTVCKSLRVDRPLYLYCHRGVGRSPSVAMAAICITQGINFLQARDMVKKIRSPATITEMTIASAIFAMSMLQ